VTSASDGLNLDGGGAAARGERRRPTAGLRARFDEGRNRPRSGRRTPHIVLAGYLLAIASVAVALGLTLLAQNFDLDVRVTIFAFYIAVVASAWIGTGPGCLAVVLSVLTVEFFWTPPAYSFEVLPEELPWFGPFVFCAILTLAWSAQRRKAERALAQARDSLELAVQRRTAELTQANLALRTEIAERQAVEEELRRRETLLAQGQKLSRTASWTWRPATGEMRWSAELFALLEVDRDAAVPSFGLFAERVHDADRVRFAAALDQAVRDNGNFSCELRIVLPDGSTRDVHSVGEVKADAGPSVEIIGTVMDLTERKRTEQALRDAEAKLASTLRLATVAELAAAIAHEINQPLAAIVVNGGACLRSLRRRPPALEAAREAAGCIVSDASRAGEVIARIRSLLRKQAPAYLPVNLNRLIREVLELTRGLIERQQIAVRTELNKTLPKVFGDPVQLQQVLINLIANAVEAMQDNGSRPRLLTIRAGRDGKEAVAIAVEDSGSGLTAAECERVFDSFYTTKADGIGVGLSICRSIIEAHDGRLWASPATPCGARFCISLPTAAEKSARAGDRSAAPAEQ
jgi:signal transduction histidine kinase